MTTDHNDDAPQHEHLKRNPKHDTDTHAAFKIGSATRGPIPDESAQAIAHSVQGWTMLADTISDALSKASPKMYEVMDKANTAIADAMENSLDEVFGELGGDITSDKIDAAGMTRDERIVLILAIAARFVSDTAQTLHEHGVKFAVKEDKDTPDADSMVFSSTVDIAVLIGFLAGEYKSRREAADVADALEKFTDQAAKADVVTRKVLGALGISDTAIESFIEDVRQAMERVKSGDMTLDEYEAHRDASVEQHTSVMAVQMQEHFEANRDNIDGVINDAKKAMTDGVDDLRAMGVKDDEKDDA